MIYIVDNPAKTYTKFASATINDVINYCRIKSELGFDTETTGFDPYTNNLLLYQIGDGENQFVINHQYYPITLLKEVFKWDIVWMMHNASFDCMFLYSHNIYPEKIWDTFLAEAVLNKGDPTVRKSLADTAYRYCKITLDKAARGLIHKETFSDRVIEYSADDVTYLPAIKRNQEQLIASKELEKSVLLENEFVKVLTYVKYCGIKLHKEKWLKKCEEDIEHVKEVELKLDRWVVDNNIQKFIDTQLSLFDSESATHSTILWSSSKQVIQLFKEIGIPVINKEGKETADIRHIQKYEKDFSIIPIYMEYKKIEKLVSTYGKDVVTTINPITGRIHTSFKQVMKTGRISSGDKSASRSSINLQNIPGDERHRSCFTIEPGNVFINADYSQQEAVVFANKSQDKNLIEFFQTGAGDMHSFIASKLYPHLNDTPLPVIAKQFPAERQKAKQAGFALQYGGNGTTIANNLNISEEEGDTIYSSYFEAFVGIKEYFDKMVEEAFKNRYILINEVTKSKCFIFQFSEFKRLNTRLNNPRFWFHYNNEKQKDSVTFKELLKPMVTKYYKMKGEIERMSYNFPIQGTAAEITKVAAIYLFNYIIQNNLLNTVKIVNLIHDELLIECPEELSTEISDKVKYFMEKAASIFCPIIPIKATPVISEFWNH